MDLTLKTEIGNGVSLSFSKQGQRNGNRNLWGCVQDFLTKRFLRNIAFASEGEWAE